MTRRPWAEVFYANLQLLGGSTRHEDYRCRGSNGGLLSRLGRYYELLKTNNIHPKGIVNLGNDVCICGHHIKERCYIENFVSQEGVWIQVGNCCVKRFMNYTGRNCEKCHKPFQARKHLFCKDCRK